MLHIEDLAHQGKAVGMHPAGGEADDGVAGPYGAAVDDFLLIRHPHGKAGQVVLLFGVEAGHLGGLPADEGAAGLDAALRHPGDDGGHPLRFVFAHRDIIQEEEGLGPAADDVVDAHGHAVDAHGVVFIQQEGQLQLGAHPVGAAYQHRLGNAG